MAGMRMAEIAVVASEKVVRILEVGDNLVADLPSTPDFGKLLNETPLDEALLNRDETLLIDASLLTVTSLDEALSTETVLTERLEPFNRRPVRIDNELVVREPLRLAGACG